MLISKSVDVNFSLLSFACMSIPSSICIVDLFDIPLCAMFMCLFNIFCCTENFKALPPFSILELITIVVIVVVHVNMWISHFSIEIL